MEILNLGGKPPNIRIPHSPHSDEKIPMIDPNGDETDGSAQTHEMHETDGDAHDEQPHDMQELHNYDVQNIEDFLPHVSTETYESPEDKLRKRQIISKVRKYKELFKAATEEIDTSNIWERSLPQLELLLENIEFCVSVRQSGKQSRTIFLTSLAIWEQLGKKVLKLQLDGLTNTASQSAELMETVDECSIKYSDEKSIDPIYRLALHVGQLSLAIHTRNSALSSAVSSTESAKLQELSKGL